MGKTNKTTITTHEYVQLVGLKTLADGHLLALSDISGAILAITGEENETGDPDTDGHAGDLIWAGNVRVEDMLRKLGITVEEREPAPSPAEKYSPYSAQGLSAAFLIMEQFMEPGDELVRTMSADNVASGSGDGRIFAGPRLCRYPPDAMEELARLGWRPDEDNDCVVRDLGENL